MGEVQWIKVKVDLFDNDKVKLMRSMPNGDTLITLWLQLLTQAGKDNQRGYLMVAEDMPTTRDMLPDLWRRPPSEINKALDFFAKYKMIAEDDAGIYVVNWEEHQNVDGMERVRTLARERVRRYREKKKTGNITETLHVTQRNAVDKDIDKEIDKEVKEYSPVGTGQPAHKQAIPYELILEHLNDKCGTSYRSSSKKTRTLINARWNEGFRLTDFMNVIDNMVAEWRDDPDFERYLRPETLFGTKFESYANRKPKKPTPSSVAAAAGDDFLTQYGYRK